MWFANERVDACTSGGSLGASKQWCQQLAVDVGTLEHWGAVYSVMVSGY